MPNYLFCSYLADMGNNTIVDGHMVFSLSANRVTPGHLTVFRQTIADQFNVPTGDVVIKHLLTLPVVLSKEHNYQYLVTFKFTVHRENVNLSPYTARSKTGSVILSIEDNGVIAKETLSKITDQVSRIVESPTVVLLDITPFPLELK